ncbi:MAG: hypothetical protein K1Y36_14545 [Blastocatellia bacterium]|nr:hypothetical protein [Blastocatellia bacterium]
MTISAEALQQIVDLLVHASHSTPEEVQAGFEQIKKTHLTPPLRLVSTHRAHIDLHEYDVFALLETGTLQIGLTPHKVASWSLRWATDGSEGAQDLVTVNDYTLQVHNAVSALDNIWNIPHVVQHIVDYCLLQSELRQHPIPVSDEELQQEFDDFRRHRNLLSREVMENWMTVNGLTTERLEAQMLSRASYRKLRDRLRKEELARLEDADAFKANLRMVQVCELVFSDMASAESFAASPQTSETVWAAFAQSATNFPQETRLEVNSCVKLGIDPQPLINGAAFPMILPVESHNSVRMVLRLVPVEADHTFAERLTETLFQNWLTRQREAANIRWFLGDTRRFVNQSR